MQIQNYTIPNEIMLKIVTDDDINPGVFACVSRDWKWLSEDQILWKNQFTETMKVYFTEQNETILKGRIEKWQKGNQKALTSFHAISDGSIDYKKICKFLFLEDSTYKLANYLKDNTNCPQDATSSRDSTGSAISPRFTSSMAEKMKIRKIGETIAKAHEVLDKCNSSNPDERKSAEEDTIYKTMLELLFRNSWGPDDTGAKERDPKMVADEVDMIHGMIQAGLLHKWKGVAKNVGLPPKYQGTSSSVSLPISISSLFCKSIKDCCYEQKPATIALDILKDKSLSDKVYDDTFLTSLRIAFRYTKQNPELRKMIIETFKDRPFIIFQRKEAVLRHQGKWRPSMLGWSKMEVFPSEFMITSLHSIKTFQYTSFAWLSIKELESYEKEHADELQYYPLVEDQTDLK